MAKTSSTANFAAIAVKITGKDRAPRNITNRKPMMGIGVSAITTKISAAWRTKSGVRSIFKLKKKYVPNIKTWNIIVSAITSRIVYSFAVGVRGDDCDLDERLARFGESLICPPIFFQTNLNELSRLSYLSKPVNLMQERVQKFLSEQGVASRRRAEEFIKSGQVSINGKRAKLGDKVDPDKDEVKVYGKIIKAGHTKIYLALNKPKGYVVSRRDPQGRKTVFSLLPEELRPKVWNVGRLDFDTEGLLILTNDGDLTQQLSHPKYEHDKEYEVTVDPLPKDAQLDELREGVQIATGLTYPAKVRVRNGKIYITIHEGKKRQIRRMFEAIDTPVKNLKRVRINKLKLPDIAAGNFVTINKEDIL
jgi:23S rRNA pseudouridine2605 synthase